MKNFDLFMVDEQHGLQKVAWFVSQGLARGLGSVKLTQLIGMPETQDADIQVDEYVTKVRKASSDIMKESWSVQK